MGMIINPYRFSSGPEFIDYSVQNDNSGSAVLTVPTHQENDFFVVGAATRNGTISVLSGWTRHAHNDALSNEWHDVFIRVATGSEPATYTFTHNGQTAWVFSVFRNVSSAETATFVAGSPQEAPSVTGYANAIYVGMAGNANDTTDLSSGFTGLTTIAQAHFVAGATRAVVAYKILTTSGATGAFPAVFGAANYDGYTGFVLR